MKQIKTKYMFKVFDPEGEFTLRFKKGRKEQIEEFLSRNDTPYEEAMKYAKEVNCPVFGEALDFPCTVIDETPE
jgi:hypothetical protein